MRLSNAAVYYVPPLVDLPSRSMPVSSSTPWEESNSDIAYCLNLFIRRIKKAFVEANEVETGLREATVHPASKEAARFAKKQSLICQVLIAGSDAQTMTGIRIT